MSHRRQFVLWIICALVAIVGFATILRWQYQPTQRRFALAVVPKPAEGRTVFEAKGCAKCHGPDGAGTADAPALRERGSLTSLPRLVTAVWNHIPRMSDAMQQSRMPYPAMSSEDMAQLFAYLYVTGVTDQSGNSERGHALFVSKGCMQCHGPSGKAPAVNVLGVADTPLLLTQALWNHASAMRAELQQRGMTWPSLKASELRDLLAYIQLANGRQSATPVRVGDPARGWAVFQDKACLDCHTLAGRNPSTAGDPKIKVRLLSGDPLPATLSQFGEAMLNHFPDMHRAMAATGKVPPSFTDNELGDVGVFLYSLRYVEPAGSPHVGATIFRLRGCAACHSDDASGASAPALRGRGQNYTAVRLAMGLWGHGDRMYELTRRNHQPWPQLEPADIGDLLTFLNTPLEQTTAKK
jgi:mono/diheme cytochrome c family protein